MKKTTLALVVMALTFASGAGAEVNNEMTRMFNQRGNATAPGYVEGSTRGVLTGGGVTIKNPIVRMPQLVDFQPPSISAGCGGIDIQGGYLSLPSAEEFVAVARAVAANAQGYAFKLALSAICDSCEDKMTQIQEKIQEFGAMGKNSCQIAQNLVNSVVAQGESRAESANLSSGEARDNAEAGAQPGEATALQRAHDDDPDKINQEVLGNLVWEAIEKNDITQMLGGSDSKALKEELMSLTGTVIACLPGRDGCPGVDEEGAEPVYLPLPATIRLKDLVAYTGGDGNDTLVYSCSGENCLSAQAVERDLGETLTDKILEAFLGKDGEPGLIALQRMNPDAGATPPSPSQRAAQAMSGQIGAYTLALAGSSIGGERGAEEYIKAMAGPAAAHYINTTVRDLIQKTTVALSQDIRDAAPDAVAQLQRAEQQMQADYKEYIEANQVIIEAGTRYEDILRNTPPNMLFVGGNGFVPGDGG